MIPKLPKQSFDLSKNSDLENFVFETHNKIDLLRKESDTNLAEQELLKKRIQMMKASANDLPSSDPKYSSLRIQIQMDEVELDELKKREADLAENLDALSQQKPNPKNITPQN